MKFQYVGCGSEDAPKKVTAFGHVFILSGEPVEVTNEKAIKKLLGNRTFKALDKTDNSEEKYEDEDDQIEHDHDDTDETFSIGEMKKAIKKSGQSLRGLSDDSIVERYKALKAA